MVLQGLFTKFVNRKFISNYECQTAFERVKEALTTTPMFAYLTVIYLDADASDMAVARILQKSKMSQNVLLLT